MVVQAPYFADTPKELSVSGPSEVEGLEGHCGHFNCHDDVHLDAHRASGTEPCPQVAIWASATA